MFDRNNDPNNVEELMIREYIRIQAQNEHLFKTIDRLHDKLDDQYDELMDLLKAEENKSAALQAAIDKDTGIVDLHEPILLYKADVASSYYYKDWLDNHAEDTGEDEGLDAYIEALNSSDKECVEWFANHSYSSYSKLVTTKERTFSFTLKVPIFGIFAYDPEYNKASLIAVTETYADNTWVHLSEKEFIRCTAMQIREAANKALKEYKNELVEAKIEQV